MLVITFSYVSDMIAMTRLSMITGKTNVPKKKRVGITALFSALNGSSGNSPSIISH